MTPEERIKERVKVDKYEKIEESKNNVKCAIHAMQTNTVTSLVFWAKDTKRASGLSEAYVLREVGDYNQMTLDYLNMLYETMCNDQIKL